jgi:hypothetical protein
MNKVATGVMPCLILVGILTGVAVAADSYDGKWIGTAPDAGDCGILTVTLAINDNSITATVSGKHGAPHSLPAKIASDGTAQLKYGQFQGTVRLAGSQFTGNFQTFCDVRTVTGTKAP